MEFKSSIIIITLAVFIFILLNLGKKLVYHIRFKGYKVKYVSSRLKIGRRWIIYMGIMFMIDIYSYMKLYKSGYRTFNFYPDMIYEILILVIFFIEILIFLVISSSIMMFNEKFIYIGYENMKFSEINYVKVYPQKSIITGRLVEISVNGKIENKFYIREKNLYKLEEIFRDKCRVIL
ncbi:hypothetical protein [Clostridium algidicarnis]|uniref:hypothetical protein n=1 Tax=Clostridium algidicarnis TaxID=37659 RepID=UPI001624B28A|nr:hypothetical protein [Clostridium algidicarnis]MBB6630940.1 hypothetical protein [Clostridium algidicarnis]